MQKVPKHFQVRPTPTPVPKPDTDSDCRGYFDSLDAEFSEVKLEDNNVDNPIVLD